LLIFDWDYPGAQAGSGTDSESILRDILDRTFCLIFIFSKADKKAEIDEIRDKPDFQQYKERLEYLDKTIAGVDQTAALVQKAEQTYAANFSFKFASTLRKKAVQSADQILSDMGRASLNDVKNHVAAGEGGKKDFVDFLAERFRASLAGKDVYSMVDQIPDSALPEVASDETRALAEKVWSSRLYFQEEIGDDMVRRGDIVAIGDAYSLILSADCDLSRFWKKNLGIINMVALHPLDNANSSLKDLLTLCVKADKIPGKPSTLLEQVGDLSRGPFVLPFVPVEDARINLLAVPKDIVTKRIDLPPEFAPLTERKKSELSVKYSHWPDAKRVCTISEPFLTPVIQHVLSTIGGIGVPDYPSVMREILKNILEDFTAAAPVAVVAPAIVPPQDQAPPQAPQ
jgi:hypothetical protein